jgi:hypothetical protein
LFPAARDATLGITVAPTRLRSSFIYLANAVNDLSGDWTVLTIILAPLILAASLCLLPDALNIQHRVANTFESGDTHNVNVAFNGGGMHQAQTPYHPDTGTAPAADPYPEWMTSTLHLLTLLILLVVMLVVLCGLFRKHEHARAPTALAEAIEIYQRAIRTAPAFLWISFLQILVIVAACAIFAIPLLLLHILFFGNIAIDPFIMRPLIIPGLLVVIVMHFSKTALVFDGIHSWHALLHSRELERGRFIKVAVRIVVFLAMLSGYNLWASGTFLVVSILIGPVVAVTGYIWSVVFVLDLLAVGVAYFTIAFFVAASVRLYQDLSAAQREQVVVAADATITPTAPLPSAAAASVS